MSDPPLPPEAGRRRVIAGERLSAFERWELPAVEEEQEAAGEPLPTAEELQTLQQQAWDEGYARGLSEGREQIERQAVLLERLLAGLAAPLRDLDPEVEEQLLRLTIGIAQRLVRRELRTDPGAIVACVREGLQMLPVADRNVRVTVHPEDARLLQEALKIGEGERPWRLVEDPVLERGGCVVESTHSRVDATVEARIAQMSAALLGGERQGEHPGGREERGEQRHERD